MEQSLPDKGERIVNEEEQFEPVNPQDNMFDDTTDTAEIKKKGYSEGNRNDSDTEKDTTDETSSIENDKEKTGKRTAGK